MKSNTIWLDSKSRYAAALIATIISVGLTGGIGIYLSSTPKASTVYYHFNIQYKMGDESTYDEIIMSMTHVMYMYDNHTNWNYTLETQFRTIEYMYENFPASFDLLQKHNQNGQLELIVPQYGHGWHLPYPEKDFRESINYTLARMNEWNLSRSGICVLQEGHWMPGFGSVAESGNFDAFVIHREQLGYFGTYPDQPVLEWDYLGRKSYAMVVPRFPRVEGGYYHCQIYSADGELLNTGDMEVDVGPAERFAFNEKKQKNHENHLKQLERKGNKFMRMDDFFEECVEKNAVAPLEKYVPELEWVPNQYDQFYNWMGNGEGYVDDGTILARNYYMRNLAQATELLLENAYNSGDISDSDYREWGSYRYDGEDGLLLEAKKNIWLAQVSDTTGITPQSYEYWYTMNKTYDAYQDLQQVIENIRSTVPSESALRDEIQINPYLNTITNDSSEFIAYEVLDAAITLEDIKDDIGVAINYSQAENFVDQGLLPQTQFQKRKFITPEWNQTYYNLKWESYGRFNITQEHWERNYFTFDNESQEGGWDGTISEYAFSEDPGENEINVKFTDEWDRAIYSPTLAENHTQLLNRSDYYTEIKGSDFFWHCLLPCCNGLLYNPAGDYGIIKNVTESHVAADWRVDVVNYRETNVKYNSTREFFVVKGDLEDVLRFANQVNSYAPLNLQEVV